LFLAAAGPSICVGNDINEEAMARKSISRRREDQRKRQANLRSDAKEYLRPGRDDFARMLLWLMISEARIKGERRQSSEPLNKLCELLVTHLTVQGFDADETGAVFEELVDRYSGTAMPFRIKRHLVRPL
jgi:hypothetical protein